MKNGGEVASQVVKIAFISLPLKIPKHDERIGDGGEGGKECVIRTTVTGCLFPLKLVLPFTALFLSLFTYLSTRKGKGEKEGRKV